MSTPLLLLHAGGCDPDMYDPLRAELGGDYDVVAPHLGLAPADEALAAMAPRSLIAGTSFGGRVALQVATAAPERVAGLVLFAASHWGDAEPSAELRRYWTEEERLVEGGDMDAAVDLSLATWIRDQAVTDLAAAMFRDGYAYELALEEQGEVVDRPVDLDAITAPTIAVSGGLDFPDFAAAADRIAAGIAGARREVVADAGHMVPLERPRAAADLIRSL